MQNYHIKLNESTQLKVFLGGTCNNTTWRDELIPQLKIKYFNPVVEDWTEDCQQAEIKQRGICDYLLYTITPKMVGVYSVAEVVCDAIKQPHKTILTILEHDGEDSFDKAQMKSLRMVAKMVEENGGKVFYDLNDVVRYLNEPDAK
jgi:hypothetical protein